MNVSVIIPAYNAEATLGACLEACLKQSLKPAEIWVVDDGSADGTATIAQTFKDVLYVRQDNAGPAAARNNGARHASGDVLVYTDSDCVPQEDWLKILTTEFDEGVVAVGGTYTNANPASWLSKIVHAEIRARHDRFGREVDFLGSFNVAYDARAFEAAGGFDETFKAASGEDNDLAYRLQDAGDVLRFTNAAVVAHYHPTKLWAYLRTQMNHGYWRMKLYTKHPERAKRGDNYAGIGELLAPPSALCLMFCLVFTAAFVYTWPMGALFFCAEIIAVGLFYLAHIPLAMDMMRGLGWPAKLTYAGVAVLRDGARGLGLARGLWRFRILKKEHAL
jgi:glycosyltransferase involved in cell wall biosynthesis